MNICPNCRHRGTESICPRDGFPMVDAARYSGAPPGEQLVGRVVDGKYEVLAKAGGGGMGTVWKARHRVMGHEVALKVMRHESREGLDAVKRFYREARASSQLSHPNTIRVTDFGATDDGLLYMAMELLRGRDLERELAAVGSIPPHRAARIALQVCKSLDEAHAAGMVHRDLKPSNIFLADIHGEHDFVKVIDFGIAKSVGAVAVTNITKTGMIVGTPRYMAPEQVTGGRLTPLVDLYALGIILYEMLSGARPFEARSTAGLLMAHARTTPRTLPDTVEGEAIPPALRALVARLLAKDPTARPANAAEVAALLEPLARGDAAEAAPKRRAANASRATRLLDDSELLAAAPSAEGSPAPGPNTSASVRSSVTNASQPAIPVPARRAWPAYAVVGLGLAVVASLALAFALGGDPTVSEGQVPTRSLTGPDVLMPPGGGPGARPEPRVHAAPGAAGDDIVEGALGAGVDGDVGAAESMVAAAPPETIPSADWPDHAAEGAPDAGTAREDIHADTADADVNVDSTTGTDVATAPAAQQPPGATAPSAAKETKRPKRKSPARRKAVKKKRGTAKPPPPKGKLDIDFL